MDEASARAEVERLANGLAGATDEGTGHSLDNLINGWTDKWIAEAEAEHAAYLVRAEYRLALATAKLAGLDVHHERDHRALSEAKVARSAAEAWLRGPERPAATSDRGTPDQEKPDNEKPSHRRTAKPTKSQQSSPFGSEGFDDPSLLAGRPRSTYLHLLVLACAATADATAFIQVVKLIIAQESGLVSTLLVIGLTAIVLYLAHSAGTVLRDLKAGVQSTHWLWAVLCLVMWLAIGLLVTWVRISVPLTTNGPATPLSFEQPPATSDSKPTVIVAAVFFSLYLGSGLAACIGAYFSHNQSRRGFGVAVRAHRTAARRAAAIAREHGVATAAWLAQVKARDVSAQILAEARQRRYALAEELKQYARVLIATRSRDPSLTDAILSPDFRPYIHEAQARTRANGRTP
ncbi:hypothetical protein F0L68_17695 [Solihabitans fulvus]|uniref:Uncharacterized protein n=1 Tax=Solihabitans fulvus TaxID=1892852 RepID=A0A5B2XDI8_9PSEU|nr:hypothetical protein [Solihabitans fulvus]KAA2261286.1 hypothetical protein F0L68_17695 [Solihabitans fulvus]